MATADLKTKAIEVGIRLGIPDAANLPAYKTSPKAVSELLMISTPEFYDNMKRDGDSHPKRYKDGWKTHELLEHYEKLDRLEHLAEFKAGNTAEGHYDYAIEKARKMRFDAEKQRLMVAQLEGELISIHDVEREWSSQIASLNTQIEKGFIGLAPKLSGKSSPEILTILQEWYRKIRINVAGGSGVE